MKRTTYTCCVQGILSRLSWTDVRHQGFEGLVRGVAPLLMFGLWSQVLQKDDSQPGWVGAAKTRRALFAAATPQIRLFIIIFPSNGTWWYLYSPFSRKHNGCLGSYLLMAFWHLFTLAKRLGRGFPKDSPVEFLHAPKFKCLVWSSLNLDLVVCPEHGGSNPF